MNDMPKRLLCIVGSMNAGGAETFLMKLYRALDKSKYQMDFYVAIQEEGFYDKEIISMGGRIFHSTPKSEGFVKSFNALRNTVKREKFKYVIRVSQHSLSALDLLAAKLGGAKKLCYRSSNSGTGRGKVIELLHILFKFASITIPTVKIAPSTEAAEFMFGRNSVESGRALLVKNAIAVENFQFNQEKRNKIRKEFKISNEFVVGHVGRFNNQKNHSFLIDVFNEIVKKNENSLLILVGKGELENSVKKKIDTYGLSQKVIFTGIRSDIPDIMMAFDAFVFPSFFEGMPNTVIEAQATGLPCIISDRITKEAKITDLVEYMSLCDNESIWAEKVLEYNNQVKRESKESFFLESGYEIRSVTKQFESLIFSPEEQRR